MLTGEGVLCVIMVQFSWEVCVLQTLVWQAVSHTQGVWIPTHEGLFVLIFRQGFAVCCLSQTHPETTHKTTHYSHLWWGEAPGTDYMGHISHFGVFKNILQMSDNVVFCCIRLKSLLKSIFAKSEGSPMENTVKCFFQARIRRITLRVFQAFRKGFYQTIISSSFVTLTGFVATFCENSQNDVRLYKQQPCQSHGQSKDA